MPSQDAPLPVTFPSGRYRFDRRIGSGGMGVVYRALDTTLNRPVAIKTIHERAGTDARSIARLRAEALAAASLYHPFVCRIYELIEAPPDTFIVIEVVEIETLG